MIHFIVPGQPVGKGSVRVHNGRAHKDVKTSDWMARCALFATQARPSGPPLDEPLSVDIRAYQERPKRLIPNPRARVPVSSDRLLAPVKPDPDNIAKAVLDACKSAGLYVDDCRVVLLTVQKWYVAVNEAPHVAVTILPVTVAR